MLCRGDGIENVYCLTSFYISLGSDPGFVADCNHNSHYNVKIAKIGQQKRNNVAKIKPADVTLIVQESQR